MTIPSSTPVGMDPSFAPMRAFRRKRRLSVAKLAHLAGVDPALIDLLEMGSYRAAPTAAEIQALARALNVAVEDLQFSGPFGGPPKESRGGMHPDQRKTAGQ